MNDWWRQLGTRDRKALVIGAVAVTLAVYLFGVVNPALDGIAERRDRVRALTADVAWLEQAVAEARQLRRMGGTTTPASTTDQALYALADRTAREANLGEYIQGVEPVDNGRARMSFNAVPFNDATTWLGRLAQEHGIRAQQFSARAAEETGRVDIQLLLVAPGA